MARLAANVSSVTSLGNPPACDQACGLKCEIETVRVGSRQQLKGTIGEHREIAGINAHKEFLGYEWLPDFDSARLPDGRNLRNEIVKAGLAWWFRRYGPNDPTLEGLGFQARKKKRGLCVLLQKE